MNNSAEIYQLLELLCKSMTGGDQYQDALKVATGIISSDPNSFSNNLIYDEMAIVVKISNTLAIKSAESASMFLNLYEQMESYPEIRNRPALLSFLYQLADNKVDSLKLEKDVFSSNNLATEQKLQPPKKSTSTDAIEKLLPGSMRLHSIPSSSSAESNLKLTQFQRKKCTSSLTSMATTFDDNEEERTFKTLNEELVQDVIYALTGIQGKFLRKDVITGTFKMDLKVKHLSLPDVTMMLRLGGIGQIHDEVKKFTDPASGSFLYGLLGQGLVSAYQKELTQYYGMVAMLQTQLNRQKTQSVYDSTQVQKESLSLQKVMLWITEPMHRLQTLVKIGNACKDLKGGALASAVYQFFYSGDSKVKSLVCELLLAICVPLQQMLSVWLLDGEIEDKHGEFFIEELPEVGSDRIWHEKYRLRKNMVPCFVPNSFAKKILITGKSINFLRKVCIDKTPIKGREELRHSFNHNIEDLFSPVCDTRLHLQIDNVYLNTSKKVLDIVLGPHRLMEHLEAMRKYLLLGKGDFIALLMRNMKPQLDRPAKDLYQHDLFSIMAAAIRSTTAASDDPEILNHLDVRLFDPFEGDSGWDIFTLQYSVKGPLSTMLEPSMSKYQILFKPLWKTKHVEFVLSEIWKNQTLNAKSLRSMRKELNCVTCRLHVYTSEMIHFIHQMQYYILFEVIECSWAALQRRVQQAAALDDILEAHHDYLEAIRIGTFLDEKNNSLYVNLESVYRGIMKLEEWQENFYAACYKEFTARQKFEEQITKSEKTGQYGVKAEQRLERDEELKVFEQSLFTYQKTLEAIGNEYGISVRRFLLGLTSTNDHNLQLFGIRLDFNEYYKKGDKRLNAPLTYEHMRMSSFYPSGKTGSLYNTPNQLITPRINGVGTPVSNY